MPVHPVVVILLISVAVPVIVIGYSCLVISGRCSRVEEEQRPR